MIRSSLLAAVLVLATPLRAVAEPTAIEKSTADALFKDGKLLMEKKEFDAACPKLAESHRLQAGGGVILALAICYEGQGKLASSWHSYREAVALAVRDKRKDREDAARAKVSELEGRLSRLTVHAPAGVTVTIDGAVMPPASLGTAIPVDGGAHVIEASATGKVSRKLDVAVANDKDRKEVTVPPLAAAPVDAPKSDPPVAAAPKPTPEEPASASSVVPYVVGGVGLIALGIGGYFGVSAISKRKEVNEACPGNVCTDPSMLERNSEARSAATISNIAIGVGALTVGAAIVLLIVDRPSSKNTTHVTGSLGPRGGSLGLEVAW